jgi:hypothetical protein
MIREPRKLVFFVFVLLLVAGNAVGVSIIINYTYSYLDSVTIRQLKSLFEAGIFAGPILFTFFPSYKQGDLFFFPYDPLRLIEKTSIKVAINFISTGNLLVLLFLSFLSVFSMHFRVSNLIYYTSIIFVSCIFCLILQNLIEKRIALFNKMIYLLFTISILLTCKKFVTQDFRALISVILLFTILNLLEQTNIVSISASQYNSKRKNIFYILVRIYFRTRTIRVNLIIAFLMKFGFLLFFLRLGKGQYPEFINLYQLMLLSSTLLFTYIHNNLWGYMYTTYQTIIYRNNFETFFRMYCSAISIAILIDLFSSAFISYYLALPILYFINIYIISLLLNIFIGFHASVLRLFQIKKSLDFVNFSSNTSITFSLIVLGTTIGVCLLSLSQYFIYYSCILLGCITLLYYLKIYKNRDAQLVSNGF